MIEPKTAATIISRYHSSKDNPDPFNITTGNWTYIDKEVHWEPEFYQILQVVHGQVGEQRPLISDGFDARVATPKLWRDPDVAGEGRKPAKIDHQVLVDLEPIVERQS